MGDGGVACVPSQHVMDRFPISESFCGGNGGLHSFESNSKSLQFVDRQVSDSQVHGKPESKMEVEPGEFCSEKQRMGEEEEKEEEEFVPETGGKSELPPMNFSRQETNIREEVSATRIEVKIASSVRFPDEDFSPGKELPRTRSGSRERNERRRRYSRWDSGHERERERDSRNNSRTADEELGSRKHEYSDGHNHGKDSKSGTWLRRHCNESESSSRRFHGDYGDHLSDATRGGGSKSRRISDDNRSGYLDKSHSRSSAERSYRNSSSSSRLSSSSRYSRHYESTSYKGARDRHGRSPVYSDRSPIDRGRHGRSPIYSERSPVDRGRHGRSPVYSEKSPIDRGRHGRSPMYSERSPRHGRSPMYSERSSIDRGRHGRSPIYSERSPIDRGRHGRSPLYNDRSPINRGRHGRSSVYSERSPIDRGGHGRSPVYSERSPIDRGRHREYRDRNHSRYNNQGREERPNRRDSSARDSGGRDSHKHSSSRYSYNSSSRNDKHADDQARVEKHPQNSNGHCEKPSQVDGALEEMPSMEEDMDICNSPPYTAPDQPEVTNLALGNQDKSAMGGWFYLDHLGMEQGPSKLCDLKKLVEDGFLLSDHLIKHSESDRWVTVENAASPMVQTEIPSVVSDMVTQLASPPEAPGNLLVDTGDLGHSENHQSRELSVSSSQRVESSVAVESLSPLEDLHIDERVEALLKGFTLIAGRELEAIAEALQTTFEDSEWEKQFNSEGFTRFTDGFFELSRHQRDEEFGRSFESMGKESPFQGAGTRLLAPIASAYPKCDASHWFAGRWSCQGGDWKRNDEAAAYDRSIKRKFVLNEGYPLCQMPKSGYQDPRGHKKEDLHHYLHFKRFELPSWAYCWQEEKSEPSPCRMDVLPEVPLSAAHGVVGSSIGPNDQSKVVRASNGDTNKSVVIARPIQSKPAVTRGLKGSLQPVVRNNACVVRKGSFFRDLRARVRGNEWHNLRSDQASSLCNGKSEFVKDMARSKTQEKNEVSPTGHIFSVHDLRLHLGKWYYLDGAGHEQGPSSFLELQGLVSKGVIQKNSSVYRKADNIWVPITVAEWNSKMAEFSAPKLVHGPSDCLQDPLVSGAPEISIQNQPYIVLDRETLPEVQGSGLPSEAVHTQEQTTGPTANSIGRLPSEAVHTQEQTTGPTANSIGPSFLPKLKSSFHDLYPQFVGYTRGKLHELVMKSYRSREFAAAINEVLDPWISAKQPKKAVDKLFPFNSSSWLSSISKSSTVLAHELPAHKLQKSDIEVKSMEGDISRIYKDHNRGGRKARFQVDESDDDNDAQEDCQKNDDLFEDLFREDVFSEANSTSPQLVGTESWGLLNSRILARVFYYLRTDFKSLALSAATCKCWNMAVKFYKAHCRLVDFSSMGSDCTDSVFRNVMTVYDKAKITSFVLTGCVNVSAGALEEVLPSFPAISSIDIRGCSQFRELTPTFQNIKWRSHGSCLTSDTRTPEESHCKMKSLKQVNDRSFAMAKSSKGLGSHFDDSGDPEDILDLKDPNLDAKDFASHAFQQGCYKRRKLVNARNSSTVLSRDAHMRRWFHRKSSLSALIYKRKEEFLASSLKDIMRENSFKFFIPKVEEIEDRMRSGYYIGRGLSTVKDDISRMCRDAMKANTRGDAGDMSRIIMLFMKLVTSLEENFKSSHERDEVVKALRDSSVTGFYSSTSKYKKKHLKGMSERRGMNRRNSTSCINGSIEGGDYASDRELRRRLSKLNKRALDSESETSDDADLSEDDIKGDGEETASDMDVEMDYHFEGESGDFRGNGYVVEDEALSSITEDREWGARMTKASLVPPVTRKYEVIDQYVIIADEQMVRQKMRVTLPEDYAEKLRAQKNGAEESDMEIPEVKDYKPRKKLGDEVIEQEVYGIDPYSHNLLLDSMPEELDWPLSEKHLFIEEVLLRSLNRQVRHYTCKGAAPMEYPLRPVIREIQEDAEKGGDTRIVKMCEGILQAIDSRPDDKYVAYRKGLGVVCNKEEGFGEDDFVVEFLGEVYPAWKWFEKQDGIRSLQKNNKDPAPEFYNIYLERPKGDRDGYDLVVVDAMHKANYASRICHSCRPNCEAKVTAVDGQYQIGIYTVKQIRYGEEITFDYNSVTESKEEYEASVCLCGSQVCRGSYLNLTGEGAFQKEFCLYNSVEFKRSYGVKLLNQVLKECHGLLDRHQLMLEACEANSVSREDYTDLGRAGLGTCLLSGLPDWLIAYSARLVRFINFERTKLPEEILRHNLEEKRKFFADISLEVEKSDAEIQAEGVYNQRLQNLALTLDKVRYVMGRVFGNPKKAHPPLERVSPENLVLHLWKGEGSLVEELLQCMAQHVEAELLNDLKSKIFAHDPSGSDDLRRELRKSLLWLRDEIRNLPSTYKCRHDAAADLIHMYAHTKFFFRVRDYDPVTSEPVYISPLDLGPKYADKLGSGFQEYRKTYGQAYCLGQLIYWHNQTDAEPDSSLARARRGCLALPDISSFYAKSQKPSRQRIYGPRTVKLMLAKMEKQPQRPWPKDQIWAFKSTPRIFGSPMLDAIMNKSALDKEMTQWLKSRPVIYQAPWDQ